uniref:Uncharacterized protein n=1 Tax=Glossina austeni TaxID=7395 RepID=A0A1A9VVI0_GLOAU
MELFLPHTIYYIVYGSKTREDMCLHKLLLTFLVVVGFIINCVLIETNELIDEHDDNDNDDNNYGDYMKIVKIANHLSMLVNGTTKATANAIAIANKALQSQRQEKSLFMVRKKNRRCDGYKHDGSVIKC